MSSGDDILAGIYYDGGKYYFPRENRTGFIPMAAAQLRRHLKAIGYRAKPREGEHISQLDLAHNQVDQNFVDYAGPIAGCPVGLDNQVIFGGKIALVTSECQRPVPFGRSWPNLEKFLTGLLIDDEGVDQTPYFYGWIKATFDAQTEFWISRNYRPAPSLALAGPRDCGKTLLIELITLILGRKENGYLWLSGASEFNSELAGAELLVVDDEAGVTAMMDRRKMNARLKSALFSGSVKIHPKGREAFSARPFWRVVYACNDEPENLAVLPVLDESTMDKLMLLRCVKRPLPMPAESNEERTVFWDTLTREIPGFLHHVLHEWEIPADLRSERTGIKAFHHPVLLESINAISPEARLLAMIDEVMGNDLPGIYTAADIERKLTDRDNPTNFEARKLLPYSNTCGTYLGRLATSMPKRVHKHSITHGETRWQLSARHD